MKSFGLTDRGKVRAENQDSFVIEYIESRDCLCAVLCDGMGGASAGSIASTLASKTYMNYLVDRIMASRAKNPDIKRHMTNACRKQMISFIPIPASTPIMPEWAPHWLL